MESARIAELLEPYLRGPAARRLPPAAYESISTYIDLLQRWNARVNLTAIRNEEEVVTRHFGESLFAASRLFPEAVEPSILQDVPLAGSEAAERRKNAAHGASRGSELTEELAPEGRKKTTTLADIGSGAGFPGIPIKIWRPEISLTLIESNHKKATFLKEVAHVLTLTDINIQATRAESLVPGSFDVVTLRAVERFESILPVAASLVAPNGRLALLIGSPQLSTANSTLPTWHWRTPLRIPGSESRILALASTQESG